MNYIVIYIDSIDEGKDDYARREVDLLYRGKYWYGRTMASTSSRGTSTREDLSHTAY